MLDLGIACKNVTCLQWIGSTRLPVPFTPNSLKLSRSYYVFKTFPDTEKMDNLSRIFKKLWPPWTKAYGQHSNNALSMEEIQVQRLTEQGLTSAPTQYMLYNRRFLQVWWPNQECPSTEHFWYAESKFPCSDYGSYLNDTHLTTHATHLHQLKRQNVHW